MKLALLSNVTVEVLATFLRPAHEVWLAPGFGAWAETAFAPPQGLIDFAPDVVVLVLDPAHGAVAEDWRARVVAALTAALPTAGVAVVDVADLADEVGPGFYDERMWTFAAMPFALKGLRALADEINRLLTAVPRKVLALDLDETLWRGVVGEDGVAALEPRTEFQRTVRALREEGVLLVVLSRNGSADVDPVWADPRQVLKPDDFAAMYLSWSEKAANLLACAQELNIGADSFVFVDDNPVERIRMRAVCPEVAVPDPPAPDGDWAAFARRVRRLYFPRLRVTDEDRRKTELYRAEAQRQVSRKEAVSLEDYLRDLAIWCRVTPMAAADEPRVVQLVQKSNQFNVCTNRYTAEDVRRLADDSARMLFVARAGDRFGDQGLIAFVQVRVDGTEAAIEDFVMSCRAMNRNLELTIGAEVEKALRARGVNAVSAVYRPTPRNAPAADLFQRLGYREMSRSETIVCYCRSF